MLTSSLPFIFFTSFLVAFSGALVPGPVLVLTINETTRRGFWAGPVIVLGHAIPEFLVVIALTKGASELMGSNLFSGIVGLIGGTILLGMGTVIIRRGRKISLQMATNQKPGRSRVLILTGALASISNPYWFIWWATIGTTYTVWSLKTGIWGVASFFSGHILGDLVWYTLVSLIVASGRRILSNKMYRGLLVACGIGLIVLGGYFTISGFRLLTS
jgi:threonine/homoserine/homoserine lactone efflux protein